MRNMKNPDQDSDMAHVLCVDPSSKRKRVFRWLGFGTMVLLLTLGFVKWRGENRAEVVQFRTQPVNRGDLTVTITATGTLQPTNQVVVGSELSGIIKSVEVDYNDRVEVGQPLARLDTSKLDAQVLQSRASLTAAKARVVQAQATMKEAESKLARFKKARELSNNRVPSPYDMDSAEAVLERGVADEAAARAAVSQAQATLDAIETDLAKAVIRSPINGIVLTRNVELGQTVAASFQAPVLFTLAEDLAKMQLHVDVDEADVSHVQEGQDAVFTVDAYPNRAFSARIVQIRYGPKEVSGVVTYETVLSLDNSDLALRPGMTATADITVKKIEDAVLVPNAALRFSPPTKEKGPPSSGESLVSKLFPRPYRPAVRPRERGPGDRNQQRVWVLRDGEPVPLFLTTGATDGIRTQVAGGEVEPGMDLLTALQGKDRR
jgi:HlyD family secretion protein